jgi:hypothetical protein
VALPGITRSAAKSYMHPRRVRESYRLREKLIKIGAKAISHGRYVTFQMAGVAVSRQTFADILSLIARLRAPPAPPHERRSG